MTALLPKRMTRNEGIHECMSAEIPFWEQYTMTIEEAAKYFRIGEHKLRKLIAEHKDADFLLWNGNRPQIKRVLFEKYIDSCSLI